MKLSKLALIEGACSQDQTRPAITGVYLEKNTETKTARLIASNGVILAILPVQTDDRDASGHIAPEAFKQARKACKSPESFISANGICTLANGMEIGRPVLGNFPKIDQLIPGGESKFSVSLDPEQLFRLAEAIGSARGVTLEIVGEGMAMRVKPCRNQSAKNAKGGKVGFCPADSGAFGLIMPVFTQSKEAAE